MKTRHFLISSLILLGITIFMLSCAKDSACKTSGKGTLKLTNGSLNTVQKIMIDGVNYGTLDPKESKEIQLAPGTHTFQQVGISGGTGCSVATVIIVECKTDGYSCSN